MVFTVRFQAGVLRVRRATASDEDWSQGVLERVLLIQVHGTTSTVFPRVLNVLERPLSNSYERPWR